jgi:hypothetical protein
MDMSPTGSLPPFLVSAWLDDTSQQLPLLVTDG